MKEDFIKDIHQQVKEILSVEQWNQVHQAINCSLSHYSLAIEQPSNAIKENYDYMDMYLSAKILEGCSERTIHFYRNTLTKMFHNIPKHVKQMGTEDLRLYLASYQEGHRISKVTVDNTRRVISGFFSWMENEDYILKSPAKRIHKVKSDVIIRDIFSDEDLEMIRSACQNKRDLAMINFLSSTGVRVGELVGIDRSDINYVERSCIVFGKGNKEREVYFDAKTKLHLEEYIQSRKDENTALFVGLRAPHERMSIGSVEKCLKKIEKKSGVCHVHPHKFRRTLATMAINKGMPIEQVQHLLGHVRIDTTMHYVIVNQQNVKLAHRKYIG